MTDPTDAEIDTLILEHGVMGQAWPTQRQLHAFARAVLAKWGTPPAVAGEPVAWLSTDSIGERYLCFTKPNDSDPVRPLVFGDTTPQPTQAQAEAITPPPIECNTEELKRAYAFGWWSALEKQRETAQAGAVPLTDKRMAKRTVTYVCPVCCASLERNE